MANWLERVRKSLQEEEIRLRQQRERIENQLEEENKRKAEREANKLRIIAERQRHNRGIAEMLGVKLEELKIKGRLEQILREIWKDGQIVQGSEIFSKNVGANTSQEDGRLHVSYLGLKYGYEDTDRYVRSGVIHTSSMGEQYTSSGGSGFYYITTKAEQLVVACSFDEDNEKEYLQVIDKSASSSLYRDDFFSSGSRLFRNSIGLGENESKVIEFMEDQLLQSCVNRTKRKLLPADVKQRGKANIARDIPLFERIFRRKN